MARVGAEGRDPRRLGARMLDGLERLGNRLPDPAFLFVGALAITWLISAWLAPVRFTELDPRSGQPIQIANQLTPRALVDSMSNMVGAFVAFPPLGLVLVALLGVGVAEQAGLVQASLKGLLSITPRRFLTPMLLVVAITSHVAGDSGFVVIIPLGGVIFAAAGRHPLLGIVAAFAGVSGGFSACFVPTSLDPLLQGFTQSAARILDPQVDVNPLCNWTFMTAACGMIVLLGWYITERVIAPRLAAVPWSAPGEGESSAADRRSAGETHAPPQGDARQGREQRDGAAASGQPGHFALTAEERRALWLSGTALLVGALVLAGWVWPSDSAWRTADGQLLGKDAPLMRAIVPLIFVGFFIPGVIYGVSSGRFRSQRDVVQAMCHAMGSVNYYLVLVFFAAQFTRAFTESNLGVLLAVKGAGILAAAQLPHAVTILGVILLTANVNLLIGSASAKWALLSPILVPMLMSIGLSPELTQAAYRIGDSSTNIVSPLMPYFPLVVVYCQRYVRDAGIGTLVALMLPYCLAFLVAWSGLLLLFYTLRLPLGLQAGYHYPL